MIRRPPRSTLFPYSTLCRSRRCSAGPACGAAARRRALRCRGSRWGRRTATTRWGRMRRCRGWPQGGRSNVGTPGTLGPAGAASSWKTKSRGVGVRRPDGAGRASASFPLTVSAFFFNDTATTEIYTLSLLDALPISPVFGGTSVWSGSEEASFALSGITVGPQDGDDTLGANATLSGLASGRKIKRRDSRHTWTCGGGFLLENEIAGRRGEAPGRGGAGECELPPDGIGFFF